MENATKALLIAAAVLIAILIISFSLIIYNMASETVGNVNLSEAETAQFNAKFTAYEGDRVSGAQVNALLTTVLTHNQQELKSGTKRYINVKDSSENLMVNKESVIQKVNTANYYEVVCTYENGLVKLITVSEI